MKQSNFSKYAKISGLFWLAICLFAFNRPAQSQNKPQLYKYKIKEEVFRYKLGDKTIEIVISKTSKRPAKFVYFNMHDNENTSVEATKETIKKFGGTLIELRNDGKRLINFSLKEEQFTVDPNRIFTSEGIVKTLKNNGKYSIEAEKETDKFAAKLKKILKNVRMVIAVHNNSNENYSIKSYAASGEYDTDAKLVNFEPDTDADDFFFVTNGNLFKKIKAKKQNVALQDNSNVTDDGSLSVYCGKNKIPYINVESESGHLREQIKMLEILREATKNFIGVKRTVRRR